MAATKKKTEEVKMSEQEMENLDEALQAPESSSEVPLKRGWIFDEIMKVGQLEAAMCHTDEQICNLHQEIEDGAESERVHKIVEELGTSYELIKIDYENRVASLNAVFDAIPGSDRHYYCQVKHRAMAFCIAAENFHARGASVEAEESMKQAGRALALTCSLAFGFEPMACLRCLDERIQKK